MDIKNFLTGSRTARAGFATSAIMAAALAIVWTGTSAAQVAENRIAAPIQARQMQAIQGTVSPKTFVARDQGELNGSTAIQGMALVFRRSAAQEADLKSLLQQQQTLGSPIYHHWLTPEQFAARYGVSQPDLVKAAAWLRSQGFKIDSIPPSADRVVFSGTAAQVEATFQTQMHSYSLHGKSHWANATPVSVPQAIAGMTLGIEHLNTFHPRPNVVKTAVHAVRNGTANALGPNYTLQGQKGEINLLAPADAQTIYNVNGLYSAGITGTGQTIGIVGQTDIVQHMSDIQNFRTLSGLNASNLPTQIVVPNTGCIVGQSGCPAVSPSDLAEANIDTEWSGAVAKDATILYVTVGNVQVKPNYNVIDSLQYAVQAKLANNGTAVIPVISMSYGNCESENTAVQIQEIEQVLQQASVQGQTVVASSGDDGSATCDDNDSAAAPASHGLTVDYPASSQYVTGVGGTSFSGDLGAQAKYWSQSNNQATNGSALSYIPETVWNDTPNQTGLNNAGRLAAGGGGASALFTKPSWQAGAGVPADGMRDVPDISLAADPSHDGYVLCTEETSSSGSGTTLTGTSSCAFPLTGNDLPYFDANGQANLYGGTSIAAPQLAAMITLWNQRAGNTTGAGNVNPILYVAAQNTPGAFHDITTGSNAIVCMSGSPNCVSDGNGGFVMSGYNAGPGYDQATGLGTVDATAMGAVWPAVQASASFSLLSNSTSVSLAPGSSGTTTLVLTPSNGFTGAVALACSGLPANTTCSFSPGSPVSLTSGAAQNVTLTLAATAAARRETPAPPFQRNWPLETTLAGVFGLTIFGFGRKKRRLFPSGWMTVLLLAAGLAAATALTACGGGSAGGGSSTPPPPPPVTATVTVTGTSGTATSSTKIQLSIS